MSNESVLFLANIALSSTENCRGKPFMPHTSFPIYLFFIAIFERTMLLS